MASLIVIILALSALAALPAHGQIGLLCSKNSDCKMSSAFVCGSKKTCECDKGYRYDFLKIGCVRFMVPNSQRCDPNQDTCVGGPNAVCMTLFLGERPTCQCKEGFEYHPETQLCQTHEFVQTHPGGGSSPSSSPAANGARPGEACLMNSDCRGFPNATCYYYVSTEVRQCNCTFDSHYYSSSADNCLPKKPMGASCDTLDECLNIPNIECSRKSGQTIKYCRCKNDFYFDSSERKCLQSSNIGEPCEEDQQCRAQPHSQCQKVATSTKFTKFAKRCACLPQKEFYEGAGTCVDTAGPITQGKPCKMASQCEGGKFAECSNYFLGQSPICKCQEGYIYDTSQRLCIKDTGDEGFGPVDGGCKQDEFNVDGAGSGCSGGSSSSPGTTNAKELDFKLRIKMICKDDQNCKVNSASVIPQQ